MPEKGPGEQRREKYMPKSIGILGQDPEIRVVNGKKLGGPNCMPWTNPLDFFISY